MFLETIVLNPIYVSIQSLSVNKVLLVPNGRSTFALLIDSHDLKEACSSTAPNVHWLQKCVVVLNEKFHFHLVLVKVLGLEDHCILDSQVASWIYFESLTLILRVNEEVLSGVGQDEWIC